jgi:hypothetical protein
MNEGHRVELQAEHIASRKDWGRYIELKTALNREHVAHISDELAPILDDLLRHAVQRAGGAEERDEDDGR